MIGLFISFELALQLKDMGFNEPCLALYHAYNKEHKMVNIPIQNKFCDKNQISSPLYQQVIDWFRDKHQIYIQPQKQFHNKGFKIGKIVIGEVSYNGPWNKKYDTYYEALNEGILKGIEILNLRK